MLILRSLLVISCFFCQIESFSQETDLEKKYKLINFDRKRGADDGLITSGSPDKYRYITTNGDTIERLLFKNKIGNDILEEWSYINGKRNGLQFTYHPNGLVAKIDYYFEGKIWDAVSAMDSSGKLLFPGTLHNGDGIRIMYLDFLNQEWRVTYKNGLPEGEFLMKRDGALLKGNLTYKKSAVNFVAAKKCVYVDEHADTATCVIYEDEFEAIFGNSTNAGYWKLLKSEPDSLEQLSQEFPEIDIFFPDPAIIARGTWSSIRSDGTLFKTVDFDDNGNAIRVIYFDNDGKVEREMKFPPCPKRKFVKRNPDGSFWGEVCPG